ncbi:vasopressin V1a receptor-like isoform X2 [Ostrea edulis]|uniref:vasopressin V1a receptor-like isoform X2 n=1 Tax=Ostrea edulis TaxID=37623 RepID=UPI0020959EE0|nr:vasopressin V1a receptor-like isoform X2 [Ostrea edulis]
MDSNYNISNGSQSSGASSGGNPYLTQQVVFELFLFFLIIIGNGAVLLVISFGSQTSRMHFVIKNLAFADLCMGLVYLLPRIVMQLSGHVFYGGNALCKIYEFLTHFVYFGSSFIMIALSIDRLIVVANPVRSLETMGRKFKLSVLACWMAACVFGIAGTFLYEYDEMDRECGLIFRTRYEFKVYFVVVLVSQFVIPTLIIGGCYVTIAIIVWRAVRRTKNATGSDYLEIQENLHASSRSRMSASGSTEHNISSAKLKTIKMTFVITLGEDCTVSSVQSFKQCAHILVFYHDT